ncbi:MAG: hypothetical protein RLZZ573_87, partial [Pseudomonadota bacterium]
LSTAALAQAIDEIPWTQRSWEDRMFKGTYEDTYTNKRTMTYFSDPFVWAYSQNFADKFRMPQAWVDPELQGALAVAWRMTTVGQTMCGFGGKAENCWPTLTCQMDIYFDGASPLPWRKNSEERANFTRGLVSTDYLPPLTRDSLSMRYLSSGSRKKPLLNDALKYADEKFTISGPQIIYFDKQIEAGIALVGYTNFCPTAQSIKAAELRFFSEEEEERTRGSIKTFAHRVYFSANYMKKIASIFVENDQPNKEKIKSVVEDFEKNKSK